MPVMGKDGDDSSVLTAVPNSALAGQVGAAWAQVAGFYSFFQGFATLKDFAWADEHNPAAAPNRKVVHSRIETLAQAGRLLHYVALLISAHELVVSLARAEAEQSPPLTHRHQV